MMDLATINELSRKAAREARRHSKEPWLATQGAIDRAKAGELSAVSIPFIGTYKPKGWKRVHVDQDRHGVYAYDGFGAYFVDTSGFGADNEPALTLRQFIDELKPGLGYALVEQGQFQGHVAVYEKK